MELKDITPIVLMFVLLGFLVAVGLTTLNTLQKNTATNAATTTTANRAWGQIGTNITIQNLKTVTSITNGTGSVVGASNYTAYPSDGERNSNGRIEVVANVTQVGGCTQGGATNCTITYTYYNFAADAPAATYKAMNALSELPNNWFLIIMVVMAATVVIGIIVKNFEANR